MTDDVRDGARDAYEREVREQIAYYRARAGEYDEWFLRKGRYDHGPEANARWFDEVAEVARAVDALAPYGDVLELAAGTGLWTERLLRHATSVTAIDTSPEVLALNRQRVGAGRVRYIKADIFDWQPDRTYDVVFFSFWLSHVPPERFDAFWKLVRACLAPEGRAIFVDSRYSQQSTAVDHTLEGEQAITMTRRLNDGREYRIVKIYYQPEELARRLGSSGWEAHVSATPTFFLYGHASAV